MSTSTRSSCAPPGSPAENAAPTHVAELGLPRPTTKGRRRYRMSLVQDFKKFLMQGNLVALATAVVIGTVFAAVVKALIQDFITPIIALIAGKPNFEGLSFTIH